MGREAHGGDVAGAWKFEGFAGRGATYHTVQSDITPLWSVNGYADVGGTADRLGPGEYDTRQMLAHNPATDVVIVPTAVGSTAMVGGSTPRWAAGATVAASRDLFNAMVTQADLAYAACRSGFPGRPVRVLVFWVQGEQGAALGIGQGRIWRRC